MASILEPTTVAETVLDPAAAARSCELSQRLTFARMHLRDAERGLALGRDALAKEPSERGRESVKRFEERVAELAEEVANLEAQGARTNEANPAPIEEEVEA